MVRPFDCMTSVASTFSSAKVEASLSAIWPRSMSLFPASIRITVPLKPSLSISRVSASLLPVRKMNMPFSPVVAREISVSPSCSLHTASATTVMVLSE